MKSLSVFIYETRQLFSNCGLEEVSDAGRRFKCSGENLRSFGELHFGVSEFSGYEKHWFTPIAGDRTTG